MSVKYILGQVGDKMGLNPSSTQDRPVLLRFLNEAADELWSECDITGSIMEQVFKVNGNQTITLPMEVGAIRAAREFWTQNPIHINQMRPRYNMYNWKDGWYNYRLKNTQAAQVTLTNTAPLVYTVATVDNPPISVTITGPTDTAQLASETVVMDAIQKQGAVNFLDIASCTKNAYSSSDVQVYDVDDVLVTSIANNKLEARFQILDVSQAPWLPQDGGQQSNYIEVLYKRTLPYLSLDSDEFPVQGYDNQLVNKCLQLYYEEQGKADMAMAYDQKATRGLARKKEEQNKATEDVVAFIANDYDTLQPRIRGARFTRWTGWRRR